MEASQQLQTTTRSRAVLLFGMPGSGKGTQGTALGVLPGFLHVSSGEIFRSVGNTSELGSQLAKYTSNGQLVPDDLTIELFRSHLGNLKATGTFEPKRDVLLLDGIPRTYEQAKLLNDDLDVLCVLYLVAENEDEVLDRIRRRALKENRTDDIDEQVIRGRFLAFRQQTLDILQFYEPGLIHHIEALRPAIQVLNETSKHIAEAIAVQTSLRNGI